MATGCGKETTGPEQAGPASAATQHLLWGRKGDNCANGPVTPNTRLRESPREVSRLASRAENPHLREKQSGKCSTGLEKPPRTIRENTNVGGQRRAGFGVSWSPRGPGA